MPLHRSTLTIVCVALLLGAANSAVSQERGATRADGTAESIVDPKALKDEGSVPDLLSAPGLSKGVDAIIAEIRKREVDIALREQRVAERERSVVALEEMIDKRAIELDRVRQNVEDRISEWTSQGQDRVSQLANVYSAMPADRAGDLLGKLELDLAVAVVRNMKKKSSAGVLAAMRPDRALVVSRRLLRPLDPKADAPASRKN